jgi:transposase
MVMQHVAQEAVETFQRLRAARKMLEELVGEDAPETLTKLIGTATTGLLIGLGLDPRKSASPAAFVKGLGLNLTIDQSGSSKRGRERISKRGHGLARKWLYLATMRLTQNEPIAKAWYQKARRRMAGCSCVKPMVALMRKLEKGIWLVARGAEFDAEKLFNIKRLEGFLTK